MFFPTKKFFVLIRGHSTFVSIETGELNECMVVMRLGIKPNQHTAKIFSLGNLTSGIDEPFGPLTSVCLDPRRHGRSLRWIFFDIHVHPNLSPNSTKFTKLSATTEKKSPSPSPIRSSSSSSSPSHRSDRSDSSTRPHPVDCWSCDALFYLSPSSSITTTRMSSQRERSALIQWSTLSNLEPWRYMRRNTKQFRVPNV